MADSARLIENLLYVYAERMDAGDFIGVADLFAHGRIEASPEAKREDAAVGREGVLAMYRSAARLYEDGTPRTRHLISNAIIEVDDDEAHATARTSYMVFQQTEKLALQPIIGGHYHDTFHRPEGAWAFDTRIMFVDLVGDLSHHLLFDL
ncbi:MAG: nuclear transport factor 2 family protein [Deltaproteobacteria bacterium]